MTGIQDPAFYTIEDHANIALTLQEKLLINIYKFKPAKEVYVYSTDGKQYPVDSVLSGNLAFSTALIDDSLGKISDNHEYLKRYGRCRLRQVFKSCKDDIRNHKSTRYWIRTNIKAFNDHND